MHEQPFIVGGTWRRSQSVLPLRNPYTGETLADVHQAGGTDAEEAVRSAVAAAPAMASLSGYDRSEALASVAAGLKAKKEEFARTITAESGKPIAFARVEVDRAVTTFTLAAEEARRITGESIPLEASKGSSGRRGIVERFPVGPVLCITPFNFPLNLVAHKVAPAVAAGNPFILKPAPQTPLTALKLGELLVASGLDPRAVNILPAPNETAETLVADDRIAMLSFTGSAAVGWRLKSRAGKKRVTLELGGNAAVIVDPSADVSAAAARCVMGAFASAGQVCIKVQRTIVLHEAAERFTAEVMKALPAAVTGDPSDERTVVGPLVSAKEADRVEQWIRDAVSAGAVVLAGGERRGSIIPPTVLTDVRPEMKVCSEEVFGPVLTVETAGTLEEAVAMVNASRYGLQAGLFTNDLRSVRYAYRTLNVGGLIINDFPTFRADDMPYGGVKDSGFGREGVRYAMDEMLEKKLLVW